MERTFISFLKDDKGAIPQGYDCPFLIGYQYQGDDYILHLIVRTDDDRLVWIRKLREGKTMHFLSGGDLIERFWFLVCASNRCLRTKYHPGVWNGSKWGCCRCNVRNSIGCELSTLWLQTTEDRESNKENNSFVEDSISSLSSVGK